MRADGKFWVIPAMVILLLPLVGLVFWIINGIGRHYGHGSPAGSVVKGVILYGALCLMRRRSLHIWHRCFLAVCGISMAGLGMLALGGALGLLAMPMFAAGLLVLMSLLQEQMAPEMRGAHD